MYHSDRIFRMWDYCVSHDQCLIRSSGEGLNSPNIDVIFYGVSYLEIPSLFDGIKITHCPIEKGGLEFVIESAGKSYYIHAVYCKVFENELKRLDTSLEKPGSDFEPEIRGNLLAKSF